jgi:hypothetical protein
MRLDPAMGKICTSHRSEGSPEQYAQDCIWCEKDRLGKDISSWMQKYNDALKGWSDEKKLRLEFQRMNTELEERHLDHLTGRDNKESEGCRNCEGTGEVAGWPSHKTPLAIPSVRCPYCLGTGQATPEAKGGENK